MTENQFLQELETALKRLPKEEQNDILQDIREYFANGKADGKTDSEIADELGSPQEIADELIESFDFNQSDISAAANELTEDKFDQVDIQIDNGILTIAPSEDGKMHADITDKSYRQQLNVDILNRTLVITLKEEPRKWGIFSFTGSMKSPKLDVRLPKKLYDKIQIDSDHGMITGERLDSRQLSIETDNGRIELTVGGHPVDLRVAVLPTMFGESVVCRVLDRSVVKLDLAQVGMDATTLAAFRQAIIKPNGIILVTGPTGSGKTTTLYSALSELNHIEDKLITTEDPIEYDIDGIVQVPIDPDIGVTFANCLRAILRQDPDKILVGEIRDVETAEIAVQASLTGHTVFSTLHTNDAPGTITRLRDMGVPPFLITATVEAILAQRLVRRVCTNCRQEVTPNADLLADLKLTPADIAGKKFYRGVGCEVCNNSGYKGRTGLFELMMITDEIRDMIVRNASTDELRDAARSNGMVTLRDAGMDAAYAGRTSLEEVVRETIVEG